MKVGSRNINKIEDPSEVAIEIGIRQWTKIEICTQCICVEKKMTHPENEVTSLYNV